MQATGQGKNAVFFINKFHTCLVIAGDNNEKAWVSQVNDIDIKSQTFTIYMIKDQCHDINRIFNTPEKLNNYAIVDNGLKIGTLYIPPIKPHEPSWLKFFDGTFDGVDKPNLKSSMTAGILIVETGSAWYAVTFGFGWLLLKQDSYEEKFGLKVALNSTQYNKLKSIDTHSLNTILGHKRTQGTVDGDVHEFGIDTEQDLVNAVTVRTTGMELGQILTGKDSVRVTLKISPAGLPDKLEWCFNRYKSNDYKKEFAWIDFLSSVNNKELIEQLDELVLKKIKSNDRDKLWLGLPEIVEWSDIESFTYGRSARATRYSDISLNKFIDDIRIDKEALSLSYLRSKNVYCYSSADDAPKIIGSIYKCLYCEVGLNGKHYRNTNFL